jgi:molecular chaperone DnaK
MAADNRTLGKFHLVGIPPAPRGVPQIEVTFDIDANGIVNVSAKDRATGKSQEITITASSGLAKEEVAKMVEDAEAHVEEDKKRREETETRNRADNLIYTTEKTLQENRDKLPEAEAGAVEKALEAARKATSEGSVAEIEQTMQDLTKASHTLAELLYKQSGAEAAGGSSPDGGASPSGGEQGDVVDAEVVNEGAKAEDEKGPDAS